MPRRAMYGSAEARLRKALQAFLGGDLEGAEQELAELVRADSNDMVAYLALAHLYRERGEVGRALRIHQNLLLRSDLNPELRSRVQSALAADLRAGGFRDRAIAAYEEVLRAEPRRADAIEALVGLHVEAGDYAAAIAVQRRTGGWFRAGDPKREAELLVTMARHEYEEGRGDDARKRLRKAVKLDPSSTRAHVLLGDIEAERDRHKQALAAWCAAVAAGAASDELWQRISAAHLQLRGDRGESFVRAHLERNPGDAAARRALARVLVAGGEIEAALSELRELLGREPHDERARAQLGQLLLDEKREAEALEAYRDWVAVHLNFRTTAHVESEV